MAEAFRLGKIRKILMPVFRLSQTGSAAKSGIESVPACVRSCDAVGAWPGSSAESAMFGFSSQLVMQRELPLRDSDDEDQDQLNDIGARQQERIGVLIGREADADPDKLQDDRSPAPPAHRHGRYSPTNVLGWR